MSVRSARYNRLGLRSPKGTSALPLERDAWAFLDVAGITSSRQQEAIIQLVRDLKQARLWTKMKAIYPFVGGTATSHKWNLKDPQDTNAAFRLTFNGGWTHSSTGALPNGSTGYAETSLDVGASLGQNDVHFSYYSRTERNASGVEFDMGAAGDPNTGANSTGMRIRESGNLVGRVNANNTTVANSSSLGLFIASRNSSTNQQFYRNSTQLVNSAVSSTGLPTVTINIGRLNNTVATVYHAQRETAFNTIGNGLTSTEATLLFNCVDRYQKFLGRAV